MQYNILDKCNLKIEVTKSTKSIWRFFEDKIHLLTTEWAKVRAGVNETIMGTENGKVHFVEAVILVRNVFLVAVVQDLETILLQRKWDRMTLQGGLDF